jgi:phage anti-repressor protein
MSALIKIAKASVGSDTVQTVNARDLHIFLEVGRDFSNWIKERIDQYEFVEDQDFVCSPISASNGRGGHNRKDYHLTLDMAKELAMVERNEKGKQARQYFIECERAAKAAPAVAKRLAVDPALSALRQAKALETAANVAGGICDRFPLLGQMAQQVIFAKIVNPVAGSDVIPLPSLEGKTYSASEAGAKLGVSANRIGRLATEHGLKTPEYGIFVLDKSRSSEKQVESFRYNERGLARLAALVSGAPRALPSTGQGELLGSHA